MNTSTSLYKQAVQYAEQADIARIKKLPLDYKALYGKAALLEKEAALLMNSDDLEPIKKTSLLRSASALAFKAGDFAEAEKLITLARNNNPDNYEMVKLDEIENAILKSTLNINLKQQFTIKGTFSAANADESEIKIRDLESRQVYSFIVPTKMFRKIVKSYWQEVVMAVGKSSPHGILTLEEISLVR
jgi:hypothetical protein